MVSYLDHADTAGALSPTPETTKLTFVRTKKNSQQKRLTMTSTRSCCSATMTTAKLSRFVMIAVLICCCGIENACDWNCLRFVGALLALKFSLLRLKIFLLDVVAEIFITWSFRAFFILRFFSFRKKKFLLHPKATMIGVGIFCE